MTSSAMQKLLIPYLGELMVSDYQDIALPIKRSGVSALVDKINWSGYPFKHRDLIFTCHNFSGGWSL
jgi:hypothetical protein